MNATEAQAKASTEAKQNIISILTLGQVWLMVFALAHYFFLVALYNAILFTILVRFQTDRFRGRSGSLTLAFGLIGFVWLGAAVGAVSWLTSR